MTRPKFQDRLLAMDQEIVIIGAGIAGLTAAAALRQAGFQVAVFEQAPQLGEVGAGLGLWSNAVRCLHELGIPESRLLERASRVEEIQLATANGKVLQSSEIRSLTEELGHSSLVCHRATLHQALREVAPDIPIHLSHRCESIETNDDEATIRFENGEIVKTHLVIGADGLYSQVRANLFGAEEPIYSGQTCYRGIADLSAHDPHILREVHGPNGMRSAVCSLGSDEIYWWATRNAAPGEQDEPLERKSRLAEWFEGWSFGFPEALVATAPDAILRNDLFDRPPLASWQSGRAILIGDAAHPTTPNLGQGACLAIEDGFALARILKSSWPDFRVAFEQFEAARQKRCYGIVQQSRHLGRIGGWSSPLAVALRELMFRWTPKSVMRASIRRQIGFLA